MQSQSAANTPVPEDGSDDLQNDGTSTVQNTDASAASTSQTSASQFAYQQSICGGTADIRLKQAAEAHQPAAPGAHPPTSAVPKPKAAYQGPTAYGGTATSGGTSAYHGGASNTWDIPKLPQMRVHPDTMDPNIACTIYVVNIPFSVGEQDIVEFFNSLGGAYEHHCTALTAVNIPYKRDHSGAEIF